MTLAARLRALLEEELEDSEPTARHAAGRLKMSVRTLHRQLAAERTTFRAVLDQLRHERASTYLIARDLRDRRGGVCARLLGPERVPSCLQTMDRDDAGGISRPSAPGRLVACLLELTAWAAPLHPTAQACAVGAPVLSRPENRGRKLVVTSDYFG